jgi:hypothetical protein
VSNLSEQMNTERQTPTPPGASVQVCRNAVRSGKTLIRPASSSPWDYNAGKLTPEGLEVFLDRTFVCKAKSWVVRRNLSP